MSDGASQVDVPASGPGGRPGQQLRLGRRTPPDSHVPGEPAFWLVIFGDLVVFGVLFGVYLYERSLAPEVFARSQQTLSITLGLTNTLVLLTSSWLVVKAVNLVRAGRSTIAPVLILGAMAGGLTFAVVKFFEYRHLVEHGFLPTSNPFYLYYFILTGLHLFHLLLGMVVLGALWFSTRRPRSRRRLAFLEGGACFWHLVDAVWVVLFPLLYLLK